MTQLPAILTTEEAAAAIRVHPETLRRWVREGKVAAIELPSGTLRFKAAVIEQMLSGDEPVREAGHTDALLMLFLALAVVVFLAAALPGQALAVVAGAALAGLGAGVLWLTVQVCSVVRALDDHP